MDPQLAAQLVQFLAPFLPYLVKGVKLAGQEAARKPGEKAGAEICAETPASVSGYSPPEEFTGRGLAQARKRHRE